ncbi:hypothetical protein BS17DRAFT_232399 [Gyrodon lividus]|nr:hypothetical protein BS17DRAFT_232399 [Gyrodon lividus]
MTFRKPSHIGNLTRMCTCLRSFSSGHSGALSPTLSLVMFPSGRADSVILTLPTKLIEGGMIGRSPVSGHLQLVQLNVAPLVKTADDSSVLSRNAMALSPEVQRTAQAEIDAVLGQNRLPTQQGCPTTLCWCHARRDIPMVSCRATWAMLQDPNIYPEPMSFRPEHFLPSN